MKNIILEWIIFLLVAITLMTVILTANNRYEHNLCSPDTVYVEVYKQKSDWELLEIAIIWQETKGNPYPEYSDGESGGLYQITPVYVDEVNRILGYTRYLHEDRKDPIKSKEMFDALQNHHNPDKDIRKAIKLHNKGDKYYQEVMDKFRMLKFMENKMGNTEWNTWNTAHFKQAIFEAEIQWKQEIDDWKYAAFLKRLKELNIDFNPSEEKIRRFKSFVEVKQGNTSTYYYNDGSIDGLRVIAFKTIIEINLDTLKQTYTISEIIK